MREQASFINLQLMGRHRGRNSSNKKKIAKKLTRKKVSNELWEQVIKRCKEGEDPWKV